VERRGNHPDRAAPAGARQRPRVHEPRRDGHAVGPSERPGQLPSVPPGLRPAPARPARGAAAGRPAHPYVRPRLRPDHALDRPLPRARPPARVCPGEERCGPDPRGGVRGRRRDRERLARREVAAARDPRTADRRALRALNDPELVRDEYADESRFAVRAAAWASATGPDPRDVAFEAVAELAQRRVLEVGCGRGELAARIVEETGAELVALDQSERMVELSRARGVDAR